MKSLQQQKTRPKRRRGVPRRLKIIMNIVRHLLANLCINNTRILLPTVLDAEEFNNGNHHVNSAGFKISLGKDKLEKIYFKDLIF